jgi:tetratricopeptide (TPR) repeat protein/predicted Ser/Thr protein kinase
VNAALYRRAREIFVRAIELEHDQRASFVESECGAQDELRAEVDSLLAAHERGTGFDSLPGPVPSAEAARIPERIGRYRILEVLGEGGMGVVYLAEQDSPRRRVALKVLHPGLASPARTKRLEHEAQILGRLHHSGIAQVYEAGHTDAGSGPQPFLAMELVLGRPLSDHAAEQGLGTTARVELLVQVARAVHHAHERGVIHRDLKPANVLVDEHGDPKVLDFGIARATAEDLRTRTALTGAGEILGTLPYMSPEQIEGDPDRVDARTDVYALGVIGYELLSGRLPIEIARKSLPEAARAIRDEEPVRLGALDRALRGDLETIFAKALEKEPARRYGSALELADELERWLAEEPIVARPPSTIYQLSKFARRNRVLVLGVAGVFVALILGLSSTWWQAVRATDEAQRARVAQQKAEDAEKVAAQEARNARIAEEAARKEAARLRSSYRFIENTLRSADPKEDGREVKVVEVLDRMAKEVGTAFEEDPESEATVRHTIGLTFFILGIHPQAVEHLRRSRELRLAAHAPTDPEVAEVSYMLGRAEMTQGNLGESESLLREAMESFRRSEGDSGTNTLSAKRYLASTLRRRGKHAEAFALLNEVLATARLGPEDPLRISMLGELGVLHRDRGELQDSERILREVVALLTRIEGPDDRDTVFQMGELAFTLHELGRYEEALAMEEHVVLVRAKLLGEENPSTLTALNGMAVKHAQLGHLDQARALWERVLEARLRVLGKEHPHTFATKLALLLLSHQQGRAEELERWFAEVQADLPEVRGGECDETLQARSVMAHVRMDQGRLEEAEELAAEALRLATEHFDLDPVALAEFELLLGAILQRLDRLEDAEAHLLAGADAYASAFGDGDPRSRRGLGLLVELYTRWERPESAAECSRRLQTPR